MSTLDGVSSNTKVFLNFVYRQQPRTSFIESLQRFHASRWINFEKYFMAKICLSREFTHRLLFLAVYKMVLKTKPDPAGWKVG